MDLEYMVLRQRQIANWSESAALFGVNTNWLSQNTNTANWNSKDNPWP